MTFANRKLTVAKCAEQKHVLQNSQDLRFLMEICICLFVVVVVFNRKV